MTKEVINPDNIFNKKINRAALVYFSGTGGAARIANSMEKALIANNVEVFVQALDLQKPCLKLSLDSVDLLILVYAVHAFDAPEPVYDWIRETTLENTLPTAVISVSGGGEVWPNTASRFSCIKSLQLKKFNVFYEKMFVMPSNWMFKTEENLALQLMRVLPIKAESTVSEILSGLIRRSKPQLSARALAFICKLEKPCAKLYAKDLKVSNNCTRCGWCVQNCPRRNIVIKNRKVSFGWKCVLCLRCVYGCPQNAIKSRILRFIVVKEGYDLSKLEKCVGKSEFDSIKKSESNKMFDGVVNYLKEDIK